MNNKKYRLGYILGIGLVISSLFKLLFFRRDPFFDEVFLTIIITSGVIFEGNLRIDTCLNKKYSWVKNPHKRLRIQVIVSFLFTSVFLFIFMYTLHQIRFGDGRIVNPRMIQLFPISLTLTFCVLTIHIGKQFAR